MLVLDRKLLLFRVKEIHFADKPHDVDGCDRVCFLFCKGKFDVKGFTRRQSLTLVTDLTEDLDTIWRILRRTCRYEINRALREGIKIRINEHYEEFYHIFKSFMSQKKGFGLPFGIGLPGLNTMKRCGTLFTAESQGEIIGGQIYLQGETIFRSSVSASKRLEAEKEKAVKINRANRLLYWEAIKYAKEKGLREFDWGGIWSEEEADRDKSKHGINLFKRSFGGETVLRYSYEKVYSRTYRIAHHLFRIATVGRVDME